MAENSSIAPYEIGDVILMIDDGYKYVVVGGDDFTLLLHRLGGMDTSVTKIQADKYFIRVGKYDFNRNKEVED